MGPLDLLNHLFNFVAPAVVVGFVLSLAAHFLYKKVPGAPALYAQAAINSIAGVLTLAVGLWFFGRDGKLASYAAMVVVIATSQWLLGGFKRG